MNTRDRIRSSALSLLNRKGAATVTFRDIANDLDISPGNLTYHYPRLESIITDLFDDLVDELDELSHSVYGQKPTIASIYGSFRESLGVLYKYRFLLIDMAFIMRSIPSLRIKFRSLLKRREKEFAAIFEYLQANGLLRKFPGDQYRMLFRHFFIITNSWPMDAEIFFSGKKNEMLDHYTALIFSIIIPYLTEESINEYNRLR